MSIFTLYLLTRMESLKYAFSNWQFLFGRALLISLLIWGITRVCELDCPDSLKENIQKINKQAYKAFKISLCLTIFCSIGDVLMPTNKDAYIILGGYYVTNSEEVKALPDNVVGAVNGFLQEYTKDLPKKKPVEDKKEIPHDAGTATGKAT